MKLTYYGHASFSLVIGGKNILFDPFIKDNPAASSINVDDLQADFIFVSHGHNDHIADVIGIAERTGAMVVSNPEIVDWLEAKGLKKLHPLNHGGYVDFGFGKVRGVNAIHSSGLPDGSYGGNPLGFVFNTPEGDFYFAADTALTMDMQLIPYWAQLKFALLPIGSNYTMSAEDAVIASDFIKCNKIIGIHYNTFDLIKIDTEAAVSAFEKAGKTLILPKSGESLEV